MRNLLPDLSFIFLGIGVFCLAPFIFSRTGVLLSGAFITLGVTLGAVAFVVYKLKRKLS